MKISLKKKLRIFLQMIKKSIYFLKRKFHLKKLNWKKALGMVENKKKIIFKIIIWKEIDKLFFDICVKY